MHDDRSPAPRPRPRRPEAPGRHGAGRHGVGGPGSGGGHRPLACGTRAAVRRAVRLRTAAAPDDRAAPAGRGAVPHRAP